MYRGQQSNAEVDDIWREKGKCMGTLQSQQLQMATETSSLVGITAEKEARSLENPHYPHLVMHLSMEDMILSQLDLIWENYIVSEYNSYNSYNSWPLCDVTNVNNCRFIPRESLASGPHILYEHGMELCKTSAGNIGFSSICYSDFTVEMHCEVKEMICTSYIQGAMTMKNLWRKRKLSAQLDGAEKRAKRSLNVNRCAELSPYFMDLNEKTNVDFIPYTAIETKNQDGFVKPCHNIEASSERNPSLPMLRIAPETCCNVKACSAMSDDGCYFRSVLKSLVISSSLLGVTEEVFSSTFIPQPDSSVDYTKLCGSLQQKGRCKLPADSDESLCLTNNTDSNINLHVRLSAHPCIPTSDVILSDVNCTEPGERRGQNCCSWAARERAEIAIATNTLKSSQNNKSSLPRIDKKSPHLGNDDKSFSPRGKTFSTQLNYPRRLEGQHFLQDINFSILAASLVGTSKNDFSFFHITDSQSASQRESSRETTDESFSLKHKGLKYEQAEVEVSLGTENLNNGGGRAHLGYKTALSKQDFWFPSYLQNGVDAEQSQKETSGNNIDFYMRPTCSKQVSYTECFQKISLEESESSNSEETYCSFRRDLLFYKSRSRQDNITTIENKPSECKSKWQNIKHQRIHQSCTKDTADKKINKELLSGNVNGDASHHHSVGDSSVCEKVIEDAEQADITFNNLDGVEEEHKQVKVHILDELLNTSPSVYVETAVNENSQQECALIKDIKIEESPVFTKENTDASSEDSKALVKNTDFQMKAQFDLVLEELKIFHTIEEEKVEHLKTEQGNRLEHTCSGTEVIQDGIKEDFPVMVGSDSEVLVTEKDFICNTKITSEVSEQEVPQQYMSISPGDEESLYSADNVEDIPKSLPWTPAFLKSSDTEVRTTSYTEKAVTFSHGIGRVTPLKTRTGPLRIGLSKKAKIKQLHPYLR